MILLLSTTLSIILFISYLLRKTRKTPKPRDRLPGPPPLPLIGNLHQIAATENLHLYFSQLTKQYGPIIQMKLGFTPLIIVSSPKLAKEVLKYQDLSFCSRPKSKGQQLLSYNNSDIIFSPYNEYWREVRKITSTHLFSLKKLQSFRPIRDQEISAIMISSISCFSTVNLSEVVAGLSRNLICRIAFGKKLDEGGMRRFDHLLQDVQEAAVGFFVSDYFVGLGWLDRVRGLIGKMERACEKLDLFYQELIDEHLDGSRAKEMDDILDVLIQLKMQKKACSLDLSWDNVKALLMDIFIAATETSAAAIVWTMTSLMKSPKIMKRLQEEIRSLVGEKGKVDEDDLPKLPYLKAVVKESLRLYPPGPLLIPRETMETCILDGYVIRPKTMVYVNAYCIARDPEYWKNPNEFMPERFLNSNIDVKGQDFGLLPFGSGRRMCPGMSMGLLHVEIVVANLVYSFDWELPPRILAEDVDMDPLPGLAVQKKNPLIVVPKPRRF